MDLSKALMEHYLAQYESYGLLMCSSYLEQEAWYVFHFLEVENSEGHKVHGLHTTLCMN